MNQTDVFGPTSHGLAFCRVTYRMTDQMGVVYYGNYLELFEMGRVELLRASEVRYRDLEADGYLLAVVHASCDYLLPAQYDDLLTISTKVATLTRAKIHFAYEVRRSEELLARGVTHHVFLSPEGRLRRMSKQWFEKLERMAEMDGRRTE